ncbi:hypothetical protein V6N11_036809 [Hibiscus sabdariffa]|uniref:SLC26A/SulP transporter domain-containing protein n=1 Tax=Hibiscus sabdariffa TaxID=183260 RepID=A0ABR2RBX0_9ROSI
MFTEATKVELISVFVAPNEVIPVGLSFGSTQGSHLHGNNEMRDMVFMNFAGSLTSCYKAIDSFFRTVENLGACCQTGVSKRVMASSVVLRLVLFIGLMYYTSLPILASIIPSAALSELIDINEEMNRHQHQASKTTVGT